MTKKKRVFFQSEIQNYHDNKINQWFKPFEGKHVEVEIREIGAPKRRTPTQNKALHLYFGLLAEALNDAGMDMRTFLKESVDIPWSGETVKEHIWKPIQIAKTKKESTTELDKVGEIDEVYEIINRHLAQKGIHVPFPSMEEGESDSKGRIKINN